ncbi:hypothetical protein AJ78_08316 [Emergomyces pasteurianus Ep9510]|uniref:Uncharacterized protein n=1 Tax=Emergomyces pasteurianus Ep9510 TaxID=1447872 RepID=A0A1J9P3N8_9EURO|nr:hypothetical protein AJ78_08316 [Emergomyces pasteurianus Ep9510]
MRIKYTEQPVPARGRDEVAQFVPYDVQGKNGTHSYIPASPRSSLGELIFNEMDHRDADREVLPEHAKFQSLTRIRTVGFGGNNRLQMVSIAPFYIFNSFLYLADGACSVEAMVKVELSAEAGSELERDWMIGQAAFLTSSSSHALKSRDTSAVAPSPTPVIALLGIYHHLSFKLFKP